MSGRILVFKKSHYEEATLTLTALLGAGTLPGEYPADLLERLTL